MSTEFGKMNVSGPVERDLIFISKATPGDDQFVLWLAPVGLPLAPDWRSGYSCPLRPQTLPL